MKKIILVALLLTAAVQAQVVNIPDANFKAKLIAIGVDTDASGEIEVPEALATTYLPIDHANISDLTGLEAFVNLAHLSIEGNQITSIDLTPFHLNILNCSDNPLTALDVSTQTSLNTFYCYDTLISSIDISMIPMLEIFYCGSPNLATINMTTHPQMRYFSIYESLLTGPLDLSNLPFLFWTFISNSHFSSIDVSHCQNIYDVRVWDDAELTYLNVKNGFTGASNVEISNCPNLLYICGDDADIASATLAFGQPGNNPNGTVNTYCSFVPEGAFNTITGIVRYDGDSNGCDAGDRVVPLTRMTISDGANEGATVVRNDGSYYFYTQTGTFTVSPAVEVPTSFNVSPAVVTLSAVNTTTIRDFCISPNGSHQDLEVVISPASPARPGFNAAYRIVIHNKGTLAITDAVTFNYDEAVLNFLNATPAATTSGAGTLGFAFSNLLPLETREIIVNFLLNSPTETPPLNISDVLTYSAVINPTSGDEMPQDNIFVFHQTVTGPMDPNTKQCLEGNALSPSEIGKYLHYDIEFENTGTAAAENIVVSDVIDTAKYDLSSLQVMQSSHPVNVKVNGNKIEFIFEGINLPARIVDPIGGHGNVLFKIRSKSDLVTGDSVTNNANIYFDYNAPVLTNDAVTTFAMLRTQNFIADESVSILPNPASDHVKITANGNLRSVSLYDIGGRIIDTALGTTDTLTLELAKYQSGIYFIKTTTDAGSHIDRVIKQ